MESRATGSAAAPADFTPELNALAIKVKLDPGLRAFLVSKDFLDPMDIGLLGADEEAVIETVRKAIRDHEGDKPNFGITEAKNLKKLWTFCKSSVPSVASAPASSAVPRAPDDEEAIPEGVPEAIEKAWLAKHGFHLSGARLLIGGDFNRVYNCLNKKKLRELPKMNPEKFRLANEGVTGESKGLFLSEDGSVSSQKKFFCEIIAHDMLWWKIRAFLSTISFLTILSPEFFPYQACENFCDALHDVILSPVAGGRLSIVQCKTAWMTMISALHVKIHQSNCTLASLTENEMTWKHCWAWHSGSGSHSGGGTEKPPSAFEKRIQGQIDRLANQGAGGGGRKQRARRGNGYGGDGGGANNQGGNNKNFNSNVPPPPNGGGKGGSGGGKRQKKGFNQGGFAKKQKGGGKGGR